MSETQIDLTGHDKSQCADLNNWIVLNEFDGDGEPITEEEMAQLDAKLERFEQSRRLYGLKPDKVIFNGSQTGMG